MNHIGLFALTAAALLAGCSSNTQQDNYREASFELCNTEVNIYSVSDDGQVRIVCADGAKLPETEKLSISCAISTWIIVMEKA